MIQFLILVGVVLFSLGFRILFYTAKGAGHSFRSLYPMFDEIRKRYQIGVVMIILAFICFLLAAITTIPTLA